MGSDESHFNVSLILRDKVTRKSPQATTFEEKGEPKRIRTEVPLLTSLTPYRWAKPAQPGDGKKREIIYLSLHCHHQNDSCIKTGSDESHFNVSLIRLLRNSAGASRIAITPRERALLGETFAVLRATVFGPLVAGVAGYRLSLYISAFKTATM